MTDASMVDLSKKYYAVHVQASNFLNGIHYIPFPDEVIERMRREYAPVKSELNWYYDGEYLTNLMRQYLMEKFSYDAHEDDRFWVMMHGDMEPVDMEAIINEPSEPRHIEVNVHLGEDTCVCFNIPEAEEEVRCDDEMDRSVIRCSGDAPYNPCIEIYRHSREFPHLNDMIYISNLSIWGIVVEAVIESIERNDNVTVYHCRNSLFPFVVVVTAHQFFWYDDETPIYKE